MYVCMYVCMGLVKRYGIEGQVRVKCDAKVLDRSYRY